MKHLVKRCLIPVSITAVCLVTMPIIAPSEAAQDPINSSWNAEEIYTILESEGGTYFGPVTKLAYSGVGEFQYLSDGVYEGSFSESKRSGNGTFMWPDGDTYVGTWSNDSMQEGTYTFADGRKFEGYFKNNKFSDGKFTISKAKLPDGWKHLSGTYKDGSVDEINLIGTGDAYYVGNLTGHAQIHYPSGNVYEGEVANGKRSGDGHFNWMKGDSVVAFYEGSWKGDVINGFGTYHYAPAEYPKLYGTFKGGRPTGELIYYKGAGNQFKTVWDNGYCVRVSEM